MPASPKNTNTLTLSQTDAEQLHHLLKSLDTTFLPTAAMLKQQLQQAVIVPIQDVPDGVVTMHAIVHCRDEDSGDEQCFTLVYPHEADAIDRRISVLSPLGSSMLGLRVGHDLNWASPQGKKHIRITDISYPGMRF